MGIRHTGMRDRTMVSNVQYTRAAMQIETPAYVFSQSEFEERVRQTRQILGEDIGLCYSMKANPFLLEVLPCELSAVEVCSPGELEICIAREIPGEKIIYSGLRKETEDIRRAIEYGVGIVTAESRLHLDIINDVSREMGRTTPVLVRVSAGSQFGIDRREAAAILRESSRYPAVSMEGLHFFSGTQKRRPREIARETEFLKEYLSEVRQQSGLSLERVEYGAGLPAYMFSGKDVRSLREAINRELEFLEEISPYIRDLAGSASLTIEMGRFFAASCGHYYTQVVDTKLNDEVNYAIVDGGSHQIRYFGQMQGMQIPFIDHISAICRDQAEEPHRDSRTDDMPLECAHACGAGTETRSQAVYAAQPETEALHAGTARWTICGSLCTTADVLARNAEFTDLRRGDILVLHQAGAYSLYECMSLFLSRDMPRIYLSQRDGQALSLLRDRIDTLSFNKRL